MKTKDVQDARAYVRKGSLRGNTAPPRAPHQPWIFGRDLFLDEHPLPHRSLNGHPTDWARRHWRRTHPPTP